MSKKKKCFCGHARKKRFFDRVRDMGQFIKMWLLLRAFADESNKLIPANNNLEEDLQIGKRHHLDKHHFAVAMSKKNLCFYFLPWFLRGFNDSSIVVGASVNNRIQVNHIYTLLDNAIPKYLYVPSDNQRAIRLTTQSDNPENKSYGTKFISIFGFLEGFLGEFPSAWSFIGLSIVPWIITNWDLFKNLTSP